MINGKRVNYNFTFSYWLQVIFMCQVFMFTGCESVNQRWVPTSLRPSFFEKKGDLEVAVSRTSSFLFKTKMTEAHAAYALNNHICISSTGSWGYGAGEVKRFGTFDSQGKYTTTTAKYPWQFDLDLAIGHYQRSEAGLGEGMYEIYFGYGYSEKWTRLKVGDFATGAISWSFVDKKQAYNRYYVQQAWGSNGKKLDYGFVFRTSIIDYSHSPNPSADLLLEPGFVIRLGYKNLKIMFQQSLLLHTKFTAFDYPGIPFQTGIGAYLMLNGYTWNFKRKQ